MWNQGTFSTRRILIGRGSDEGGDSVGDESSRNETAIKNECAQALQIFDSCDANDGLVGAAGDVRGGLAAWHGVGVERID